MMLTHFAAESVRDFLRIRFPGHKTSERLTDDRCHLEAAVAFITRSIEQGTGCASSKGYKVGKGWLPPYRETTGYIIPTLLDVADHLERPDLASTAERLGEWLSERQEPSGGFVEGDLWPDTKPIVFNTGQILHGFNALILRRGRQDLVPHARRAGDFLVSSADETGSFVRNEHHDMVHSYNVRSAWALLTLGRLLGETKYENVALANADWTVAQQVANGFFLNNVFQPGWNANTHGIAYVLQGLIEIHCISGRASYLAAVRRAAESIVSVYGTKRYLASEIDENWEPLARHLCLTGYAQLAIVFFRLYGLDGDKRFLNVGLSLLDDVAATQNVTSPAKPYYGGIKGSFPFYGRYAPLQYPNWATKFFIDALLAKQRALAGPTGRSTQLSAS
ncbi:hypothetical protein [Bradyrhizobium sp. Tv2a-2]|uniref:hypothetical protein n=1 Tax=Bradyrhizobium sp. Tv2a-2 TaxID=113395 RepID=UPI0003FAB3D7|nr:hypothetical protein [Bradyrhizobium sp. Tv2a-2]